MKREIRDTAAAAGAVLLGNTVYSAAVALFVIPHGLITSGTTGIALFLGRLTGVSVSLYTALIYLGTFLPGALLLGRRFALSSALSSVWYPLVFSLLEGWLVPLSPTDDPLLATLLGGMMIGAGLGLVLRVGASSGGTDIPILILHKYTRFPVSLGILLMDAAILAVQALGADSEAVLHGLLLILVYSFTLRYTMLLGKSAVQATVISRASREICRAILDEVHRGATLLDGVRPYSGERCTVVMTVLPSRELARLRAAVRAIDPDAFLIVHTVRDVRGNGFGQIGN